MKPQVKSKKSVQSSGITETVKFGIKSSGLHHVLGILRDQLYSDKVGAVIREYSCNAYDAQVEAGCAERPIEVSLPTQLKLEFKVRDFGSALNEDDIQNVYAFYGESTKRNSNDVTGMLGIGSKSAFAYGDNFVINSYIDGTKHIYNAFIDPSQVGQISKIGTQKTTQENGIEIVVPVKYEDVDEFWNKSKDLFKWFKVRPELKNATHDYKDYDTMFEGDGWRYLNNPDANRYYSGDAIIVMGNIGYPLDSDKLNMSQSERDEGLGQFISDSLVLDMAIGDVEIAASRENLQYTEYTRKNIIKKLREVKDEMTATIEKQFDESKTMFAAKQLWGSVFDTTSRLYSLRNVLKDKLEWNGENIGDNTINCLDKLNEYGKEQKIELSTFKKGYRSSKFKIDNDESYINCYKNTVVIENDLGHRRGVMGRVLNLLENENKKVYLIDFLDGRPTSKFKSNTQARKLLKERGLDCKMLKLSELEKRPLHEFGYAQNRGGGTAGSQKSSKHSTKEFVLNKEKLKKRGWSDAKSSVWDTAEIDIDNDSGIYVELDHFYIKANANEVNFCSSGQIEPNKLGRFLEDMEKVTGVSVPKVFGFKINSKSLGKVKDSDNWTNLWDWAKNTLKEQVEAQKLVQQYVDRKEATAACGEYRWLKSEIREDDAFIASLVKGEMKTLLENIRDMRYDAISVKLDGIRSLGEELGVELDFKGAKPTIMVTEDAEDCNRRYGMLKHMEFGWRWRMDECRADLINYVNIVDVCNSSDV
jgi:hypothetical protein